MSSPSNESEMARSRRRGVIATVRRSLITGTAILLPLGVTLLVLGFVLSFISDRLTPVTKAIRQTPILADSTSLILIELVTVGSVILLIFVLGFFAEFSSRGDRLGNEFDELMESLPGVGSVYTSFNEMSEILLDSDTDSFQEVKLVEYPGKNSYTVAFKTADTPNVIEEGTGHEEMVTLFMPMAPNPVMGGFVIHVSKDRVVDVDMTVEQGIRSIVTSGVAIGDEDPELRGLSESEMRELGQIERSDQQTAPDDESPDVRRETPSDPNHRTDEYEVNIDPEDSDTAQKIVKRHQDRQSDDRTETVPAEQADRNPDDRGETDDRPATQANREKTERDETDTPPTEQRRTGEDDT